MTKRILLFLLTLGMFVSAHAYTYQDRNGGPMSPSYSAACTGGIAHLNLPWTYKRMSADLGGGTENCYATRTSDNTEQLYGFIDRYGAACFAPNVQDANGECKAPTPPPCSDTNKWVVRVNYTGSGPYAPPTNWSGCTVGSQEMQVCRMDPVTAGATYCLWQVQRTGATTADPVSTPTSPTVTQGSDATPTDKAVVSPKFTPAPDSPSTCPTGSVQAGSDSSGIPICIGTGTLPKPAVTAPSTTTSPTVSKTNADGSVTTTTTVGTKNADGSTSTVTNTTVTGTDGTVSKSATATTSLTPGGLTGRADDPNDANDLCKRNPTLSICRNSAVSGTCGAITCDGDAIQCSTLRAAAALQCKVQKDSDDVSASSGAALGDSIIAGNDPVKGNFPSVANATVVQAPASLDTSGWLGNRACFSDKAFTLQGKTFTIPLSKTCDYLVVLRYALMAVAGLVSFRMLSGAILR